MDLDELVLMFWHVWYEGNRRSHDVPQEWFGRSSS
jgi:hypothetical protein